MVKKAVDEGNPTPVNWLPIVAILLHRPLELSTEICGDRKPVALIEKPMWISSSDSCHLCQKGSRRVEPEFCWREL